ncbi:unnamed protein product [Rotaria sp. Silwood2]|nr:unnamed protein product [Rotaria sp. Silwood2]CAF2753132.1 unnamed protein product [Rotaria sp. Silwood2]CAF3233694.1 unnamed protein product [Rotaria sp. Silwood2]CAF4228727.1 unnamed protein product [Rotaria sp. Silwood2]CAF4293537.1 unnamed protein product [Rotaria sp. Silwood2]
MPQNTSQPKLNAECSTVKSDKHAVRKRFSKFLSKLLSNFNQPTQNYSSNNRRCATSVGKHELNYFGHQKSLFDTNNDRMPYGIHYRRRSTIKRNPTLTSIQEENETELMNGI